MTTIRFKNVSGLVLFVLAVGTALAFAQRNATATARARPQGGALLHSLSPPEVE